MTAGYLSERQQRERIATRGRVTDLVAADFERTLRCVRCGQYERCFEAAHGAKTAAEHAWIDPAEFVCVDCYREPG